jgi:hypothetical protein
MKRREFISRLSLLGAGIIAAPSIVVEEVVKVLPTAQVDPDIVWIKTHGHTYWYFRKEWELGQKIHNDINRKLGIWSDYRRETYKYTGKL